MRSPEAHRENRYSALQLVRKSEFLAESFFERSRLALVRRYVVNLLSPCELILSFLRQPMI